MENCALSRTVDKIGTRYTYRFLLGVDASADCSELEKHKWSTLGVIDHARFNVFFDLMILCVLILALCSSAARAESANSDFKRGESAEAREDYDTAYDLYQKAVARNSNDLVYKTALYRVKISASGMHMSRGRKFLQGGDEQSALSEFIHAATHENKGDVNRYANEVRTEKSLPDAILPVSFYHSEFGFVAVYKSVHALIEAFLRRVSHRRKSIRVHKAP